MAQTRHKLQLWLEQNFKQPVLNSIWHTPSGDLPEVWAKHRLPIPKPELCVESVRSEAKRLATR
jgi:hypothetical protein